MNPTKHGFLGQFRLVEGEDSEEFSRFAERTRAAFKPEGAVEEYLVDRWIKDTWRLNRLDNVEPALLVNQESVDDLSISDLLNVFKFLCDETRRRFYELPEIEKFLNLDEARSNGNAQATKQNERDAGSTRETQSARAAELLRVAVELSSLEPVLSNHLSDRLSKAGLGTRRAESTQSPGKTDRAEGEPRVASTEAAGNTMARAFARNRGAIALALRYRSKIERSHSNALHELQRLQAARRGQAVAAPEVVDVHVDLTGGEENKD